MQGYEQGISRKYKTLSKFYCLQYNKTNHKITGMYEILKIKYTNKMGGFIQGKRDFCKKKYWDFYLYSC